MREFIDREKLLDELGESASHHAESGREYQLLLRDRNIVREQPTADVIERSKIDEAIKEMEINIKCNTDQKTGKVNILGQGQIMMLNILKRNIGE